MRITVRVKPRASRPQVGGLHGDALVVAVREPAVDGRATTACLDAVAAAFGVRRSQVRLVSGAASRTKVIEIDGRSEPEVSAVLARLTTPEKG